MVIRPLAESQYHKLEVHSSTVKGTQRKTFDFLDLWLPILLDFIIQSFETVRMIIVKQPVIVATPLVIIAIPPVIIAIEQKLELLPFVFI